MLAFGEVGQTTNANSHALPSITEEGSSKNFYSHYFPNILRSPRYFRKLHNVFTPNAVLLCLYELRFFPSEFFCDD